MQVAQNDVSLNVASLHQKGKPCYANHYLASLVMAWTENEEAERLRDRFAGVNRAEFARNNHVPGGAAMIYQHITGRRPISIEAAQAYAKGFGCKLEDISPRLADEARKALSISEDEAPPELLESWDLLTHEQRQQFVERIKEQANTNKAIMEQLAPAGVVKRTVRAGNPVNVLHDTSMHKRRKDDAS